MDHHRAAVADDQPSIHDELVALGVSAEVVVVVEHENAGLGQRLAEVVGGGKPAQPRAHDDGVEVLYSVRCLRFHKKKGITK